MRNLFFAFIVMGAGLMAQIALPQKAMAQEDLVVIVFDANRAIAASKAGRSVADQLSTQIQKVRADAEETRKNLQDEVARIEEQRNLMAPDALQSRVSEFRTKEAQEREKLAREAAAIQAGGEAAQNKILEVMQEELNEIARARKAHIVMRREAVFYASPLINVTEELVVRLDKKLTSVKVTPIEQKPPAQ